MVGLYNRPPPQQMYSETISGLHFFHRPHSQAHTMFTIYIFLLFFGATKLMMPSFDL